MNQLHSSLKNVCERYPAITFAYLFGSQATGQQTAMSDIDIAIYHLKNMPFSFNDRLQFHGDCCRILKRNDVDVLVLNTTKNLILLEEIIRKGEIIYNINQQLLDEFELKTLHAVCDFKNQRRREMIL